MRGTAALLVVVFHLLKDFNTANPLRHAYLAVDFFFLLSGFVVGYAYDARWSTLRIRDFFRLRLVHLHPMVLLAVAIGLACYWFDSYVDHRLIGPRYLLAMVALGALLLPASPLPNHYGETHSLNGPCWSLFQEYLANVVYAFVGPRLGPRVLAGVMGVAAAALVATALSHGHLQGGWNWDTFWIAPVRVTFPLFAGLLVFRSGWRVRLRWAYPLLSGGLLVLFTAPAFQPAAYYEAFCVAVVFPMVVAAGAGSGRAPRATTASKYRGPMRRWSTCEPNQ